MVLCYSSVMAFSTDIATVDSSFFFHLSLAMIYLSALVPLFYIVVLVVYWLVVRKKLPQKLFHKLVHRNTTEEQQLLEDSLPDKIVHAEALIPAPMSGGEHHSGSKSDQGLQRNRDATY